MTIKVVRKNPIGITVKEKQAIVAYQSYIRNDVEASYFTFMIYLNGNFEGGQTTFNELTVQPKQGSALVFLHHVEHEGRPVI